MESRQNALNPISFFSEAVHSPVGPLITLAGSCSSNVRRSRSATGPRRGDGSVSGLYQCPSDPRLMIELVTSSAVSEVVPVRCFPLQVRKKAKACGIVLYGIVLGLVLALPGCNATNWPAIGSKGEQEALCQLPGHCTQGGGSGSSEL